MKGSRLVVGLSIVLGLAVSARAAHIAEFEAVLDAAQQVPAPVGTSDASRGTAEFIVDVEGAVLASVTFEGLTGEPTAVHVHQGHPGVTGPIHVDFAALLGALSTAGAISGAGVGTLPEELRRAMFEGELYVDVHTASNPEGEIRGKIVLRPGACSCETAKSPGAFKACVRKAMRAVEKDERADDFKMLRRSFVNAACGKATARKKAVACCLPLAPAQNIVTEPMCASVKEKVCSKLGGTALGTGVPCAPSPCGAASAAGESLEETRE